LKEGTKNLSERAAEGKEAATYNASWT